MPLLIDEGDKVSQKRIKEIKQKIEDIVEKKRKAGIASGKARKKPQLVQTHSKRIDKFNDVSAIDKARNVLNNGYE